MQLGAVLPQSEIGDDPADLRRWILAVAEMGYGHIAVYDHVLGADPAVHAGWSGPYDVDTTFHEPFVTLGFAAALVDLELVTDIIVLPQRQTALVAKQAAQIDVLSGGRVRLGVGVGWNAVEYEALGEDFSTRGRRQEEQIALMRRLWTERSVTFDGEFHTVTGAGLAPLPVQRPIPVWLGGRSDVAYRRVGRLADGWFPMVPPGPRLDAALETIAASATEVGRDPSSIGMEGRIAWDPDGATERSNEHLGRWAQSGASHVSVNTMGAGLRHLDAHLEALEQIVRAWT